MPIKYTASNVSKDYEPKLFELQKLISNGKSAFAKSKQAEFSAVSEQLFKKAPEPFLKRTSVETLFDISTEVFDFYQRFLNSEETNYSVEVIAHGESDSRSRYISIYSAIWDQPFIIDSLTEALANLRLNTRVVLHPIVESTEHRPLSLCYIQVDSTSDSATSEEIKKFLETTLFKLILVTEDYIKIKNLVTESAKSLKNVTIQITDQEREDLTKLSGNDISQFLNWLVDGGFIFMGAREWQEPPQDSDSNKLISNHEKDLGIFRAQDAQFESEITDVEIDFAYIRRSHRLFRFSKLLIQSPIRKRSRLEMVLLRFPEENKCIGIIGILTSKAMTMEAASIPIIREKLNKIIDLEEVSETSHDHKAIVAIINSMPKAELFSYRTDVLRGDVNLILGMHEKFESRVSITRGIVNRFIRAMVVIPKDRFSGELRNKIQRFLEKSLAIEPSSAEVFVTSSDEHFTRIHYLLPNPTLKEVSPDVETIQAGINKLTLNWIDLLNTRLQESYGKEISDQLIDKYVPLLPEKYKATHNSKRALFDIQNLEALGHNKLSTNIIKVSESEKGCLYSLKIYCAHETLTLSNITPIIENCGFKINWEEATALHVKGQIKWSIHELEVIHKSSIDLANKEVKDNFLSGLTKIFLGEIENSQLNCLLVSPGLKSEDLSLVTCFYQYLLQIKFTLPNRLIEALTVNQEISGLLVNYFHTKFDPSLFDNQKKSRTAELTKIQERIKSALKHVPSVIEDRILRAVLNLIEATVRTNFFQTSRGNIISLKIDCAKIEKLPEPKPFFEIFVSSPEFEGVHLRGGKIARGGIRWSERPDDFRTEVLGLMKTQKLKNSIIVPTGAKGGFVIKNLPSAPDEIRSAVENCYRQYIRSLLHLCDNMITGGEVVHPENTLAYDAPDPYFVVAADKGTATFSDLANKIAVEEFNFWLGDAFASGGSNGYDHKKLGITARGAWECSKRHFIDLGIDFEHSSFTAVGIGDMAGDVFGNGLLQSKNFKLLAAFNHRHIFIDPNPDTHKSFLERQRLFNLPKSTWEDYDKTVISNGGGIYERNLKEIILSEEARKSLGIKDSVLSGSDLIKAILTAPADIIWNGGIGTYIKATSETNHAVEDRQNDEVRVNARDLRAKIFAEGGNLGLTQAARIEFAKEGGRINTDAIDNSAGVAMSDIEVNLKILLQQAIFENRLNFEDRNKLLEKCVDSACDLVLARNKEQGLCITLATLNNKQSLGYYQKLIADFEKQGILNPTAEILPDEQEFEKRTKNKTGLIRPELSILVGFVKNQIKERLLKSNLLEDPTLETKLINYFPEKIAEDFKSDILNHPLRKEIIATAITNSFVEKMGPVYLYIKEAETGASKIEIILSFLIAQSLLNIEELTQELHSLDTAKTSKIFLNSHMAISRAIDNMSTWLIEHGVGSQSLNFWEKRLHQPFQLILCNTETVKDYVELARYQESYKQLLGAGLSTGTSAKLASLAYASAYLDVAEIAVATNSDTIQLTKLYAHLSSKLNFGYLIRQANAIDPQDRWEGLAIQGAVSDIRRSISAIAKTVIAETKSLEAEAVDDYLKSRAEVFDRFKSAVDEFKNKPLNLAALIVISNQLDSLKR